MYMTDAIVHSPHTVSDLIVLMSCQRKLIKRLKLPVNLYTLFYRSTYVSENTMKRFRGTQLNTSSVKEVTRFFVLIKVASLHFKSTAVPVLIKKVPTRHSVLL